MNNMIISEKDKTAIITAFCFLLQNKHLCDDNKTEHELAPHFEVLKKFQLLPAGFLLPELSFDILGPVMQAFEKLYQLYPLVYVELTDEWSNNRTKYGKSISGIYPVPKNETDTNYQNNKREFATFSKEKLVKFLNDVTIGIVIGDDMHGNKSKPFEEWSEPELRSFALALTMEPML